MDILSKISLKSSKDYSNGLTKKLATVTKVARHIVRKVTEVEALEIGGEANWFMHNNRQCVLERRECGQWIVWAF
jgi:hypothetical protein